MSGLVCHPLTAERWEDLLTLFGPERGGCAGCWCMWFRLHRPEFVALGKSGRRDRLRALVEAGRSPGLLGYLEGRPVGWVAMAPREEHAVIIHARITRPIDDRDAWAITCFYLSPKVRRRGLTRVLLDAAVEHARNRGVGLVEAYPSDPAGTERMTGFIGIAKVFRAAGFVEVARRSPRRPIMRKELR